MDGSFVHTTRRVRRTRTRPATRRDNRTRPDTTRSSSSSARPHYSTSTMHRGPRADNDLCDSTSRQTALSRLSHDVRVERCRASIPSRVEHLWSASPPLAARGPNVPQRNRERAFGEHARSPAGLLVMHCDDHGVPGCNIRVDSWWQVRVGGATIVAVDLEREGASIHVKERAELGTGSDAASMLHWL